MSLTVDEIEAAARQLPENARAELLERLLRSFEQDLDLDESVAEAWAEEAERRDEEMSRTGDPGIPAEEVFSRIQSLLR
ncbi:MAG TPA: addiction module protein [Thermoanaerobaculia bacterium]|nr:addiction module protein [Thermoanaerobaculia bacterium]